jgi:hypothetical protein
LLPAIMLLSPPVVSLTFALCSSIEHFDSELLLATSYSGYHRFLLRGMTNQRLFFTVTPIRLVFELVTLQPCHPEEREDLWIDHRVLAIRKTVTVFRIELLQHK